VGQCAQPIETDRTDKPPYVSYWKPDPPYNQELCTSQLRSLKTFDQQFGEMLSTLEDLGEYEHSLIVLTSDNGYHWGERGWFSKFYPY